MPHPHDVVDPHRVRHREDLADRVRVGTGCSSSTQSPTCSIPAFRVGRDGLVSRPGLSEPWPDFPVKSSIACIVSAMAAR
jgi:hypothetical protein